MERTYQHIDLKNRLRRALWNMIYIILFRPFGTKLFQCWRNFLLRCFGAQIHPQAGVYSTAKVWCPWKLQMEENAWIGPNVNCYNVDWIKLGKDVTISQGAYLCTASHDISKSNNPLIIAPVVIEDQVWIGADAFVGMGVTIRQGAVVGARACVFKDVESWTVVGGNPAKFIKKRIIK